MGRNKGDTPVDSDACTHDDAKGPKEPFYHSTPAFTFVGHIPVVYYNTFLLLRRKRLGEHSRSGQTKQLRPNPEYSPGHTMRNFHYNNKLYQLLLHELRVKIINNNRRNHMLSYRH